MNVKSRYSLIIGLGNPGAPYERSYHNIGFLFVDYLIKNRLAEDKRQLKTAKKFEYLKNNNITVVKPKTFMNESGNAVKEAIKYFGIKPGEILIAHDDADIEIGEYKFSFGRGSAGHKGAESIIKILNTKNLWRLRIGIAKYKRNNGAARKIKAEEYVLKTITASDERKIQTAFEKILAEIFPEPRC